MRADAHASFPSHSTRGLCGLRSRGPPTALLRLLAATASSSSGDHLPSDRRTSPPLLRAILLITVDQSIDNPPYSSAIMMICARCDQFDLERGVVACLSRPCRRRGLDGVRSAVIGTHTRPPLLYSPLSGIPAAPVISEDDLWPSPFVRLGPPCDVRPPLALLLLFRSLLCSPVWFFSLVIWLI